MAFWGFKLVGAAMSQVALAPASPEPGCLDGCDPPLQRLWGPDAPRNMPESRARSRGNLKRMMIGLFIAAQVGGTTDRSVCSNPSRFLKKQSVPSRSGVSSSTCAKCATSKIGSFAMAAKRCLLQDP